MLRDNFVIESNDGDQLSIIVFEIGWEQFVIELLDAKEIIQSGQIRRLPKSLDFIEGIYNYRGDIIHIINLKKKLNLDKYSIYKSVRSSITSAEENELAENETEENKSMENGSEENGSEKNFIIIVNINNKNIGFFVDRIINVAQISAKKVEALSPIFQTSIGIEYIKGIVKFEDRPRILIDLGKVLSEAEQYSIQKEVFT
ncbi:MAG: chemotaxis protein CheW [Promethearchaeota archaeon]